MWPQHPAQVASRCLFGEERGRRVGRTLLFLLLLLFCRRRRLLLFLLLLFGLLCRRLLLRLLLLGGGLLLLVLGLLGLLSCLLKKGNECYDSLSLGHLSDTN